MKNDDLSKAKKGNADVVLDRSVIYQFLSTCFLEPDDKTSEILKDSAYRKIVEEALHNCLKQCGMNGAVNVLKGQLKGILRCLGGISLKDMNKEYGHFFGAHLIAKDCPICESFYGTSDIFQLANELADISGFYNAFGLTLSEELKERADHLGTELEFMHFLTYKEVYSLENEGEEKVEICRDAEKRFLKEHLGRWVGNFSRLVEKKPGNDFYPSLAKFLKGFISLEMYSMDIEAEEYDGLNMAVYEEKKNENFTCDFSPNANGKEGIPC